MFDRVIVADWSANATPKLGADSIWVCETRCDGAIHTANLSTRHEAESALAATLADEPTTLLCVDFSLGYPVGSAAMWGLRTTPAWAATWGVLEAEIDDGPRNANNRFEVASSMNRCGGAVAGPFWGCPPARATPTLTTTKPPRRVEWPAVWRTVEATMREQGHRPFDCWQLLGAGSVGSQTLTGVPVLERLRRRFAPRLRVWPFDTGLRAPRLGPGDIVVAEVWPSLRPVDLTGSTVRDEAQVVATARWLSELDAAGRLSPLFAPHVDDSTAIVDEEGWVLGVDTVHRERVRR